MKASSPERHALFTLVSVAVFLAYDLVSDFETGTSALHVTVECLLFAATIFGAWRLAESARHFRGEAAKWRKESEHHVDGLVHAIDAQLGRWGLSPTEKEITFLLLKGLSHKEIATIRNVAEATVRKQSFAIYQKAGLSGRAELSAFFLEDWLAASPRGRAESA